MNGPTGRQHPLHDIWQACVKADSKQQPLSRLDAVRDAYRRLSQSGWEGWRGDTVSLAVYIAELDALIWPNEMGGDHSAAHASTTERAVV